MNRSLPVLPFLLPFLLRALESCGQPSPAGLDDCTSTSSKPDQRIAACTLLIDAGQLSSQHLATAFHQRGLARADKRDFGGAISDYNEALRINPQNAGIHNSAAWLLATAPVASVRNGARAVELARKAAELSKSKDADILDTLAATYAEAANFSEAVRWQEKALEFPEFAKDQGDAARKWLERYRKGQPYHQAPRQ